MAQNITLLGASYSAVPAVQLPKTGGGTATFTDVTDTTAAAADVAQGKYFYTAAGVRTQGTSSGGGGGGSSYTLIATAEYTVNTTSTSQAVVGTITLDYSYWSKNQVLYVRIRDKAGKRNGYFYGSDTWIMNYQVANGSSSQVQTTARIHWAVKSSGDYTCTTSQYGVYVYGYRERSLTIYRRYNSTYSLTINGTFLVEVYAMDNADGKPVFD